MKNMAWSVFCCLTVLASVCFSRQRAAFDADWSFHLGEVSGAQEVDFDDAAWRTLDVPHDWSIEAERSQSFSGRNSWLPGGIGWYRKEFVISEDACHVEIQFDGVYRHAEVWVNGRSLGVQYDGYTSFYYDLTPYLHLGSKNTIAVRVDNSDQPNCRWYSGSGIFRHVWLTQTAPLHIPNWGIRITTPEVSDSSAVIQIQTEIENQGLLQNYVVETTLLDSSGHEAARVETAAGISMRNVLQTVELPSPALWSVDAPNLFSAVSCIKAGGRVVDQTVTTFGVRSLRFDAKKGFFLNGQPLKIKGVCLHHDAGVLGAAVPEAVLERRLRNLRTIGCNAIRTSHNPPAPEFLDLCDRLGFLVMDEFVDKWEHKVSPNADPLNDPAFAEPHFDQEWKKNFRQTIRRDRNHPCVIVWSVGNENNAPGSGEENSRMKKYGMFVRSIDPTRPVISGMERGKDQPVDEKVDAILDTCSYMDLISLNYGEQWCRRIAHRNPGKPFLSTESYTYFNSEDEVRFASIERSPWIDVIENDSNMGLFLWVGISYLGEVHRKGSWPSIGSSSGLFDYAGFRTIRSYLYEAFWSDKPMVHIAVYEGDPDDFSTSGRWGWPPMKESWNQPAGASLNLVTYSNCEFVDLYLNGRKIGRQKMSDFSNWIMKWREISYEPGTIRAVGIRDGKAVCSYELKTTGRSAGIGLNSDLASVVPGDIVQVEVQLSDAEGNAVNDDDRELMFAVEGGDVLGLDNGALTADQLLQEKVVRSTHKGRCLAILRAGPSSEALSVTIASDGLPDGRIEIKIK